MSVAYKIVSFDPSKTTETLMEAYLDFDDQITLELIPEQGLSTRDSRKKNLRMRNPTRDNFVWLAINHLDGEIRVLGYSRLSVLKKNSPAYEKNGHIANCSILVLSKFRNLGIGSALLEKIKIKALEFTELTDLIFRSYNKSGYLFLEKHKAKLVLEQNLSHLKMSEVDWDLIEKWNTKGVEVGKKLKVEMVEIKGSIPEDLIEEYALLYTDIMNQQPLGSLQHRNVTTPKHLELELNKWKKKTITGTLLLLLNKMDKLVA